MDINIIDAQYIVICVKNKYRIWQQFVMLTWFDTLALSNINRYSGSALWHEDFTNVLRVASYLGQHTYVVHR